MPDILPNVVMLIHSRCAILSLQIRKLRPGDLKQILQVKKPGE